MRTVGRCISGLGAGSGSVPVRARCRFGLGAGSGSVVLTE